MRSRLSGFLLAAATSLLCLTALPAAAQSTGSLTATDTAVNTAGAELYETTGVRSAYDYFSGLEKSQGYTDLYSDLMSESIDIWNSSEDFEYREFPGHSNYNYVAEFHFGDYGLTQAEALALYYNFRADNPIFYFYDTAVLSSSEALYIRICSDSVKGSDRAAIQSGILTFLNSYKSAASKSSAFEAALAVHSKMCNDLRYAYDYFTENGINYRSVSQEDWAHTVAGMVMHGEGVCESYAKTFQMIMNYYGFNCLFVTGEGINNNSAEDHAWNLLRLDDNKYYCIDVTWDDQGSWITYNYFAKGKTSFYKSHSPDQPIDLSGSDAVQRASHYLYSLPSVSGADYAGKADLSKGGTLSLSKSNYDYEAMSIFVDDDITVKYGSVTLGSSDYTVSYSNNVKVGKAAVTVTGKGIFSGSLSKNFNIRLNLADTVLAKITLPSRIEYTGSQVKPAVTVKTYSGQVISSGQYTVTYGTNKALGSGTLTVKGNGTYATGSRKVNFTIYPCTLTADNTKITIPYASYTYRGKAICPAVTVKNAAGTKLVKGTDYTVSYSNNTFAGTATIAVTGKGNYSGTVKRTFTVKPLSLTSGYASVSIPYSSYTYSGKAQTPEVTLKFVSGDTKLTIPGAQYSVSYSNNIKVGTAVITIKGISTNVTGTYKKTFVVKPAKNKITSLTAVAGGGFKVAWTKATAGSTGYQVLYCKDKDFKKDVHSYTSTNLSDLSEAFKSVPKPGETWYVKVRSFVTKDGKTTSTRYGNYSNVMYIKTKK
ncbi:MAG: hypothetical protein IKO27_03565 [Ruminococcus sp.]|nr:hypothetical protein [Ruminococcus sp.]